MFQVVAGVLSVECCVLCVQVAGGRWSVECCELNVQCCVLSVECCVFKLQVVGGAAAPISVAEQVPRPRLIIHSIHSHHRLNCTHCHCYH